MRKLASILSWEAEETEFNKIFILGAGAIGSVYGAFLSEKNNVVLVGNKNHVRVIREKGLQMVGEVNKNFKVKAETRISEIPTKALVVLTTKAYDSERAVESIKGLLKEDTVILVLQNGLGNEKIVKKIVGEKVKVFRGITSMAAEFLEFGKVRFWNGETILEKSLVTRKIAEIFNESGLKTFLAEDIRKEVWKKLVLNCVVNPLTAIFGVRNCEICGEELKWIRHEIIKECMEVGKAEKIEFEPNFEEEIERKIGKYTNFSSMYQDILKGKKTEIDFLNGKIVELGRFHGIKTPVNETIFHLIKFLEVRKCGLMN